MCGITLTIKAFSVNNDERFVNAEEKLRVSLNVYKLTDINLFVVIIITNVNF